MERRRLGNSDLMVSIIGLGCYGMSGAYGPADDAESIATIRSILGAIFSTHRPAMATATIIA
jgi:aryl-alcohol dehydrogenase-like predicted oxidoreductase